MQLPCKKCREAFDTADVCKTYACIFLPFLILNHIQFYQRYEERSIDRKKER